MKKRHSETLTSEAVAGDYVQGITKRKGKVVGYGESARGGRSAFADAVTSQGDVRSGNQGKPPQNEVGASAACSRLIDVLNQRGADYGAPYDPKDPGIVDCEATGPQSGTMSMQVVRACTDTSLYKRLHTKGEDVRGSESARSQAEMLRRAIELKVRKIPVAEVRVSLTLVLDAMEFPGLCFDDVVAMFRTMHGAWVAEIGFGAVWLVGPATELIHQLA